MNIANRNGSSLVNAYRPRSSFDNPVGQVMGNIFDDFFAPFIPHASLSRRDSDETSFPRLNVAETEKGFEVEAELPGVAKEDIKVALDNHRVSIEAETKQESEKKDGERVIYAERSTRRYARSFTLPAEVDDAQAQAKFENGILTLSLPKKESAQAKRISVQ
jgi:HSP20 family protein